MKNRIIIIQFFMLTVLMSADKNVDKEPVRKISINEEYLGRSPEGTVLMAYSTAENRVIAPTYKDGKAIYEFKDDQAVFLEIDVGEKDGWKKSVYHAWDVNDLTAFLAENFNLRKVDRVKIEFDQLPKGCDFLAFYMLDEHGFKDWISTYKPRVNGRVVEELRPEKFWVCVSVNHKSGEDVENARIFYADRETGKISFSMLKKLPNSLKNQLNRVRCFSSEDAVGKDSDRE